MTNLKKRAAMVMAGILVRGLAIPAATSEVQPEPIRVGGYKGSTLEAGERSGLIIGPSGTDYSAVSSGLDTVSLEQVLTVWAAVARSEGTAEIAVSNSAGEHGSATLTSGSAAPTAPEAPPAGTALG